MLHKWTILSYIYEEKPSTAMPDGMEEWDAANYIIAFLRFGKNIALVLKFVQKYHIPKRKQKNVFVIIDRFLGAE